MEPWSGKGGISFLLQREYGLELPRRLQHPKRRTIGIRVPDHPVCQALLAELGEPLMSSTLILRGHELPETDAQDIRVEHNDFAGFSAEPIVDLSPDGAVVFSRNVGFVTESKGTATVAWKEANWGCMVSRKQ